MLYDCKQTSILEVPYRVQEIKLVKLFSINFNARSPI